MRNFVIFFPPSLLSSHAVSFAWCVLYSFYSQSLLWFTGASAKIILASSCHIKRRGVLHSDTVENSCTCLSRALWYEGNRFFCCIQLSRTVTINAAQIFRVGFTGTFLLPHLLQKKQDKDHTAAHRWCCPKRPMKCWKLKISCVLGLCVLKWLVSDLRLIKKTLTS